MDDDEDIPDTRVFVSGLPPNFTSNQLGAHFAGRYQITDAVVIPDRRIGFVGFRNYTLAKSAIKYFDKTYIRMSRISVMMAKAVEIERTSTSQSVPAPKQISQERPARSSAPESVATVAQTTSHPKSNHGTDVKPYVPVQSSNKRKRGSGNNLQDEPLRPSEATSAMLPTPEHENGPSNSVSERESRDLKKAKRKERKERLKQKIDFGSQGRVEEGVSSLSTVSNANRRRKTKEGKAASIGSDDENVAAPLSDDLPNGRESQSGNGMKKKGKNKDASTTKTDGKDDPSDSPILDEKYHLKKTDSRQKVDDDTKGGVAPINDDAFGPADQIEQQRRKSDIATDNDWLRSKTNRVLDLIGAAPKYARSGLDETEDLNTRTTAEQEVDNIKQPITPSIDSSTKPPHNTSGSSARLFVRNLPYTANELEIEKLFSKYGHLDEVHVVRDKAGSSKGISYVQFSDHDHANHALRELDGKSFQGRLLHILEAADKKFHRLDEFEISKLPVKKQKALKRKIEAGGSVFQWNSMYMNPNAVLSSVADRLGVSKADLIDASSADAAVKQAHAETHVIQETKAFLATNGVNLDAFRQHERDDTILLVKNFPFGTTTEELRSLFSPYGEIIKFLLPPSGITAVLQYAQPSEGSQAIRHLAYRNFKGSVLYLEIGPQNLFDKGVQSNPHSQTLDAPAMSAQGGFTLDKVEEVSSSTLFIRNLNFITTTSGLTRAFKPLDGFLSAKVKTKFDPRKPQQTLSMGFGFVEFRSNKQALTALAAMKGHRLDDHELLIQISRKATDAAEEQRYKNNMKKIDAHKTKIIIKNLPFEATKKDVRALLSAYGQLRSVKVPQKFNHDTRGFAFADFVTAREAANAMEALKDTHLLGRRLVLEFAEEEAIDPEAEIRAMENKVGRQTEMIQFNKMTGSARKKFSVGTQDDDQGTF